MFKLSRRRFCQWLLSGVTSSMLPWESFAGERPLVILSAWSASPQSHRAGWIGAEAPFRLPTRGHHLEPDPQTPGMAWVFARRPGRFLWRIDWRQGRLLAQYTYPEEQHGFGHGILTSKRVLLTTDNDLNTGQGVVTTRHPETLEPLQAWPSGGIGPHELLMWDAHTLVVANGGILTLPETGRVKLNRQTMSPCLTFIEAGSGQIEEEFRLENHLWSIRHLARCEDGTLGVALQSEDQAISPLAARWNSREGLSLLRAPDALEAQSQGYAASIAACGEVLAVTATKGNAVAFWDTQGRWLGAVPILGPAGIAPTPDGRYWVVSNETGDLFWIETETFQIVESLKQHWPVMWDNHLKILAI